MDSDPALKGDLEPVMPTASGLKARRLAGEALPSSLAHLADGALGVALERAIEYAHLALAPATEKAYADDWAAFRAWCAGVRAPYLPALPAVVAAYLAHRAPALGRSGLRLILAAIAHHHRHTGHVWPSRDPVIVTVMKGILRNQQRPVRPAAALTSAELRTLLAGCGDDLPGVRDRALLLIGFAGALRRSELVALDYEDLSPQPDGLLVRIRRSKGDQEGEGALVRITRGQRSETCPVRALETWLRRAGIEYGAVFRRLTQAGTIEGRLTGNGVWRILRRRGDAAGFTTADGERLSPHGLRAGFITEAYLNGALDEQVGAHARQKSLNTTRLYRRRSKTVAASPTRLLDL